MNPPREINWRREAIFPAQAMAEACLLAPWLLMFLSPVITLSPESITTACLAVILGTLYASRVMEALRINTWVQRGLILLGILGVSAAAAQVLVLSQLPWASQGWNDTVRHPSILINLLPGGMLILLSVVWLFWRGLRMAGQPVSVIDAMLGFQLGVIVLALFAMISPAHASMVFVPVFFFSELLAVGLTRVEAVSMTSSGRRLPFSGWWMTTLTGMTGLSVLIEITLTALVLGIGLDKLFMWIAPALAVITLPFLLIMTPVLMLISYIVKALVGITQPILSQLSTLLQQAQAWIDQRVQSRPPLVDLILRVLGYVVIIAIVLAVLYVVVVVVLKVGRRSQLKGSDQDEQSESVFSAQALLRKLRERLRNRLARLRNLADIAGRFGAGGIFAALTIRRIYAQTVKLAASRGYPRPAAHTPYEHLKTLRQAFPGCEADLAQITEAYVGVHYGELPERPEALEEIRAAFERIKTTERPAGQTAN